MSRTFIKSGTFVVLVVMLCLDTSVFAQKELAVPTVSQLPQNNWCWAASSEAVLRYTGNAPGMCNIADWARQQSSWGNANCCTNGMDANCNRVNFMFGTSGSIQSILTHWGANSDRFSRSLTLDEVKKDIDNDEPIIVRWGWTSGGGHFVVLHGYDGSNVNIMDPWSGPTIMSYSSAASTSTRTWTHTLAVTPKRVTYVVDDTGSMWDDIDSVKSTIISQINGYKTSGQFVRYTLITYKDDVTYRGVTTNHDTIISWVGGLFADGGGDCPEDGYDALDMAAAKAPNSNIWWMTDADSHGGFLRMLQTRFRLLFAGCNLYSSILGSCGGGGLSFTALSECEDCGQNNSVPYDSKLFRASFGSSISTLEVTTGDIDAYTAAKELSSGTGGLFFAVGGADISSATNIILEEIASNALIERLNLSAGSHAIPIPVDESVTTLKITIDMAVDAVGSLSVNDPNGETIVSGEAGVQQIIAGNNSMLLITSPALKRGVYSIDCSSTHDYILSVSGVSEHAVNLLGDTTVGIGEILPVQLAIWSLSPPTGPAGPGPDGPGGPLPPILIPPEPMRPFELAKLKFFTEKEDGSDRHYVDLFDDGLHDDKLPGDGIYGGSVVFESEGQFRLGVTDNKLFQRVTNLLIASGAVSISGPNDTVALPGATVTYSFSIKNIGVASRTFEVQAASSAGWADLTGVPSAITLDAGGTKDVNISVTVPVSAINGDSSVLTLIVVAIDDPSINDSTSVTTRAWVGPLLNGLDPTTVRPRQQLKLIGNFGTDPGVGNRSTNQYNIAIAGYRVFEEDILGWTSDLIIIRVPEKATSGLVSVTARGVQSNALELVVLVQQIHVTIVFPVADQALQDGATLLAEVNDVSGVASLCFSVREPNGGSGVPIGKENLAGTLNSTTGKWECNFDTTQLPDGYYVVLAKGVDTYGNVGWSQVVPFSIRNWAIITMLPSTPNSKAGRTMPVKFSIRIAKSVDPKMPFVYNDDLEIRIYNKAKPTVILQKSRFGSGSTDYRIDTVAQMYQTNFKTGTTPATYVVEIWRPAKNFKVGSFTFATTK